ncbi:replication initiation protein [Persicobacter psychrovividus]|uniref:Initiator Rep protein WH1 domain-containing protein n=1 Tax=Persicobacter psychrovividus TaxID=387638 RepID=A0ABN6LLN3_9BACT|nr:hypothetical protein PEPS_47870 [Persicobacter psychrovividus]
MSKSIPQKEIRQHNKFSESIVRKSALSKNIVYLLLNQLSPNDPNEKFYTFSYADLSEKIGTKVTRENMNSACELLMKPITIKNWEGTTDWKTVFFTDARYNDGLLQLKINPTCRPFFFDLKEQFTSYSLNTAIALKSKYSKQVYELLMQWKMKGGCTYDKDELCKILGVPKVTQASWTRLCEKVLDVAQREINEVADIKMKYEGIKRGRGYKKVKFTFTKQKERAQDKALTGEEWLRIEEAIQSKELLNELIRFIPIMIKDLSRFMKIKNEKFIKRAFTQAFLLQYANFDCGFKEEFDFNIDAYKPILTN